MQTFDKYIKTFELKYILQTVLFCALITFLSKRIRYVIEVSILFELHSINKSIVYTIKPERKT